MIELSQEVVDEIRAKLESIVTEMADSSMSQRGHEQRGFFILALGDGFFDDPDPTFVQRVIFTTKVFPEHWQENDPYADIARGKAVVVLEFSADSIIPSLDLPFLLVKGNVKYGGGHRLNIPGTDVFLVLAYSGSEEFNDHRICVEIGYYILYVLAREGRRLYASSGPYMGMPK